MQRLMQWLPPMLIVLALLTAPGSAADLDTAKAAGQVGERIDGYVGAVGAVSAELQALIDQTNAARKARYADIAAKNGAPVEAVAQIAGQKLIARTPAGQYALGADGAWRRK